MEHDDESIEYLARRRAARIVADPYEMEDWLSEHELNLFDVQIEHDGLTATLERVLLAQLALSESNEWLRQRVIDWMQKTVQLRREVKRALEEDEDD